MARKPDPRRPSREEAFRQFDDFKERVREAYPLDRAIEDFSGTRFVDKSGSPQRRACCPFHTENTPSFNVRPGDGFYKCFGAGCNAGGDLFTFIMDYCGVSFPDAVRMASSNVGIDPPDGFEQPSRKTAPVVRRKPGTVADRRTHPAQLRDNDMTVIPENITHPREGRFFEGWHPGNAVKDPQVKRYKPAMVHDYRDIDGNLLISILRIEFSGDRGKIFMPFRFGDIPEEAPDKLAIDKETRKGWVIKGPSPDTRRPVYGMEKAREWARNGGRNVLVVEGEKTCDAASRLVSQLEDGDKWLVLSPIGGASSALYPDWTGLLEVLSENGIDRARFVVWPDGDHPKEKRNGEVHDKVVEFGRDIIGGLASSIVRADLDPGNFDFVRVKPPENKENGWDLADAEDEGWSSDDVMSRINETSVPVTPEENYMSKNDSAEEAAASPSPFDGCHDDADVSVELHDTMGNFETDLPVPTPGGDLPSVPDKSGNDTTREIDETEIVDPYEDGGDDGIDPDILSLRENPYFRCLGNLGGVNYFMSLRSGEVFEIGPSQMRPPFFLHLAPGEFWIDRFPGVPDRNGNIRTDWEAVTNAIIKVSFYVGKWDPRKAVGQGAWIDKGRVVFNTGSQLWVEGAKTMLPREFDGELQYTLGQSCEMPDFDAPFSVESAEPRQFLDLIGRLNWSPEMRRISVMSLFGWLCIGPICGVLGWRPHLWLDGERGAGKSWVINHLIKPVLGDYAITVKADSSESGLRNTLNGLAFPLIFDEAEAEREDDKARIGKIIRLARHSASPDNAFVAQGVPGGGGQKHFAIASTFLMCSITPQLEQAADRTRFARARLGKGLGHHDFVEKVEMPAKDLLTPEFSRRMIARIVMRAKDMAKVFDHMERGLRARNIEARMADVYGTFLAGAWLLLEDGIPENHHAAMQWADATFDVLGEISAHASEISEDKDHKRVFDALMGSEIRAESAAFGARNYVMGEIIEMALGVYDYDDGLEKDEAAGRLSRIGIRLGKDGKVADDRQEADALLIHKNSPALTKILEKTPYANSYADVMRQTKGVRNGKTIRFSGLGPARCVEVPLEHLSLSGDDLNGGEE